MLEYMCKLQKLFDTKGNYMYNKPNFIATLVVSSIGMLLSIIFLVLCVMTYFSVDVEYNDLTYEELTFEKYEMIFDRNDRYEIYLKEYSKPFVISPITEKAVHRGELLKLKENDKVQIYYGEPYNENYQFEIYEIKSGSAVILSLADCIMVNQRNQMYGIIVCPIMALSCGMLIVIFLFLKKKQKIYENAKNDLGTIRIEYEANGNIIRVYNSPNVCSLVINGEIVDQYFGLVAGRFILKGEIDLNDTKIPIEAKMGHLNMRLYYNGEVVSKEFMGLG